MQLNKKRRYIQLIFLSVSIVLFSLLISGIFEVAHSFCPMSPVCFGCFKLGQRLATGLFPAAGIFGIILILHSIFKGRYFCGYACPFGTIQELIYSINPRSKSKRKHNIISIKLHRILKWLKYLVLAAVAFLSGLGLSYIYMQFCPVMSIAHIQMIRLAGVISLVVIFLVGYFIERFWCNYLCPFAALLNIAQYIGKLLHLPNSKIRWNKDSCINCMICNNVCPMQIDVQKSEVIEDPECIYCERCQMNCPIISNAEKQE